MDEQDGPADEQDGPANGQDRLAQRFETCRSHLRAVAYRLLGSLSEADDAVQEAWLRLSRTDADSIENLPGWLHTVVSRLCLDMLRSRSSRREEPLEQQMTHRASAGGQAEDRSDPEEAAVMAESVGRALLVVLDTLTPAERIAFVLHDTFAVPFDQIAPVVDRSPATTKKLASRARHKVRGTPSVSPADLARQRRVVEAFLAAARDGDMEGLLAVLAPDVVRRADRAAVPPGIATTAHGAHTVAEQTVVLRRRAEFAEPALVNGAVGVVVAPRGRLLLALTFTVEDEKITQYEVIAAPSRLELLDLAVLAT
ncbi:sigma-70 family RNA polymerase sigma factor [Streptomyces caniferus]|uniref:sigma-70 family RNA polymerase sigma factor n=1 Tax=Streptomyces caniferus TaxID=285557 RepID=UPI0033DD0679